MADVIFKNNSERQIEYENIFEKCNQPEWHIVPATKNWEKVNFMAKIIIKAMEDMNLKWPELQSEKFKK